MKEIGTTFEGSLIRKPRISCQSGVLKQLNDLLTGLSSKLHCACCDAGGGGGARKPDPIRNKFIPKETDRRAPSGKVRLIIIDKNGEGDTFIDFDSIDDAKGFVDDNKSARFIMQLYSDIGLFYYKE